MQKLIVELPFCKVFESVTKYGKYCVTVTYKNYKDRLTQPSNKKRFYRKTPITNPVLWVSKNIKSFETHYIGQILVTDFRNAMDAKLISKSEIVLIKEKVESITGIKEGTYTSREWQNLAARELYNITQNEDFFMTDCWLSDY